MLGAIAGDIIGSIYEGSSIKTTEFPLFRDFCYYTDDTVLTLAVADALMQESIYPDRHQHYVDKFHDYFCLYPDAGYGDAFYMWADQRRRTPYGSWGNGSAMRVSPVAYAFNTLEEVLQEAQVSAEVTHSDPEGIAGAQAVAAAIFLARQGRAKFEIKDYIENTFHYNLSQPLDVIRPVYHFDVSCAGSVPQAIIAFLASVDFEFAVRNAVSLGGDSDTQACIAGSIAEPFYGGVPEPIAERALTFLDEELRETYFQFVQRYGLSF